MKARQAIHGYKFETRLGVGGAGEVWLARHEILDKVVAIKMLHPHLSADPQFQTRFLREAKAMAQLEHRYILSANDCFTHDGDTFMVMPYLEGGSLRDEMDKQQGRLPIERALRYMEEILEAVNFAHQQGIIHRDIKPSNILLSHGHVKVADFGIAKLVGEKSITSSGSVMGTIEYMSPEQIKGTKNVTHTCDVYSCACVCYEMLTGQPPFGSRDDTTSEYDIMHAHINENPRSIRDLNPAVDAHTEAVVLQALAKDPDDRFGGCKAMQQALLEKQHASPAKKKTVLHNVQPSEFDTFKKESRDYSQQPMDAHLGKVGLIIFIASIIIMVFFITFFGLTTSVHSCSLLTGTVYSNKSE